jgi:hypothetical protein
MVRRWLSWVAVAVAGGVACGGVVEGAGSDAGEDALPRLEGARVFMALDSKGTMPESVFFTDTPQVYCVAKLASPKPGASVVFTIRELGGKGGVYATHRETMGAEETEVDFELPHDGAVQCDGYCVQNGVGCPAGFETQGINTCSDGAACCYGPLADESYPYPVGNLECEVEVGGDLAGMSQFTVTYPATVDGQVCAVPASDVSDGGAPEPPYQGLLCAGWVPEGAMCKGCVCSGQFWACPAK